MKTVYLVELYHITTDKSIPVMVYDTEDKADDYIKRKLINSYYNGSAYYRKRAILMLNKGALI